MKKALGVVAIAALLAACTDFGAGMKSFADGLQEADKTMRAMGYPAGGGGAPTSQWSNQPGGCYLRGESTSGVYRSCFYTCAGGNIARTVGAGQMCPIN